MLCLVDDFGKAGAEGLYEGCVVNTVRLRGGLAGIGVPLRGY